MYSAQTNGPKGKIRGFIGFFFLHFITLGIYNPVWWFKVAGEVNAFLGQERMSGAKMVFLSPLNFGIYFLLWQFKEGPRIIKEIQGRAGLPQKSPFAVSPWAFQRELNKVWNAMPA